MPDEHFRHSRLFPRIVVIVICMLLGGVTLACESQADHKYARVLYRSQATPCGVALHTELGDKQGHPDYRFVGFEDETSLQLVEAGPQLINSTLCQWNGLGEDEAGSSAYVLARGNFLKAIAFKTKDKEDFQLAALRTEPGKADALAISLLVLEERIEAIRELWESASATYQARSLSGVGVSAVGELRKRLAESDVIAPSSFFEWRTRGFAGFERTPVFADPREQQPTQTQRGAGLSGKTRDLSSVQVSKTVGSGQTQAVALAQAEKQLQQAATEVITALHNFSAAVKKVEQLGGNPQKVPESARAFELIRAFYNNAAQGVR